MKFIFVKSKIAFVNLLVFLVILGGILLVESGPEPWLDSEIVFMEPHDDFWESDMLKDLEAGETNRTSAEAGLDR